MERYWCYGVLLVMLVSVLHFYINILRHLDLSSDVKYDRNYLPHYKRIENIEPFNLSRCKSFANLRQVLIAINYNHPHYTSIPILKRFYMPIFGKVVFCGSLPHDGVIQINERSGYLGYECIATAIRTYGGYRGYLHINDDVLLNWWTIIHNDLDKIWTGTPMQYEIGHEFGQVELPKWHWWRAADAAHLCEVAFKQILDMSNTTQGISLELPKLVRRYYNNTKNRNICVHSWSDVFYIPKQYASVYSKLSEIHAQSNVFLEVAVPTILAFLLNRTNSLNLGGVFLSSIYGYTPKYLTGEVFYETYNFYTSFYHPFKLESHMYLANHNFLKNVAMAYGENVRHYCIFHNMANRLRQM